MRLEQPPQKTWLVDWALLLAGIVILAAIYLIARPEKRVDAVPVPTTPPAPVASEDRPRLVADVRFSGGMIGVANLGDFDWVNVQFVLNPSLLSGGYSYGLKALKKRSYKLIPAADFTKHNGVGFSLLRDEPDTMKITCQDAKGNDYFDVVEVRAIPR